MRTLTNPEGLEAGNYIERSSAVGHAYDYRVKILLKGGLKQRRRPLDELMRKGGPGNGRWNRNRQARYDRSVARGIFGGSRGATPRSFGSHSSRNQGARFPNFGRAYRCARSVVRPAFIYAG